MEVRGTRDIITPLPEGQRKLCRPMDTLCRPEGCNLPPEGFKYAAPLGYNMPEDCIAPILPQGLYYAARGARVAICATRVSILLPRGLQFAALRVATYRQRAAIIMARIQTADMTPLLVSPYVELPFKEGKFGAVWALDGSNSNFQTRPVSNSITNS